MTLTLPFEVAPWNNPLNFDGWQIFRVGTCQGQWRACEGAYEILGIINEQPGNGHFQETMRWFEQSCQRDGYDFRIREVWNKDLAAKLLKHGFVPEEGTADMVKRKFE